MIWFEFEYNKPCNNQSIQERLRYENGDDSSYEEFYNIEDIAFIQEDELWSLKMELE